ncbi:MAG TPA: uracil-DNA glycosylase [Candidatus Angelobacter sp.]
MSSGLVQLNQEIVACTRCSRLVEYCRKIGREKRRAYMDWEYWAKPVPGFGDPEARLLILGLAPGAHGSNRTGRPFTGDGSGYFMYPVLHQAGFASQPTATHRDDGLRLKDAYITAAVRCAPPQNKPAPSEIANCATFLDREMAALKNVRVVVALGRIGFDAYLNYLKRAGLLASKAGLTFAHGAHYETPDGRILLCSYHPSLQNTNTGKLTEKMFLEVFRKAKKLLEKPR